jgi:hypothetical protein
MFHRRKCGESEKLNCICQSAKSPIWLSRKIKTKCGELACGKLEVCIFLSPTSYTVTVATIVKPTTMAFNNLENKEVYLEVLASREKNSNSIKIAILELLNDNMFRLVQSLKDNDTKLKYHQTELEGKYFRFGIGNQSMINLARGNASKILNIETRIVDIFSVYSISRMQIEAFAMSFYLFYEKIDENEFNFRYDIYKIHGLAQQSKYDAKGEYGKKMKEKILKELKQTQSHMSNNTIVGVLSEKERKRYMNPPFAKLLKTDDLMD